jgi:hypothetical protein
VVGFEGEPEQPASRIIPASINDKLKLLIENDIEILSLLVEIIGLILPDLSACRININQDC